MKVGILSPGDMGSAVGRVLHESGATIFTSLEGRSDLTRLRARECGFEDTASIVNLVMEVDVLLSILVPSEAMAIAESVGEAMRVSGRKITFADCNAVSPRTAERMAAVIEPTGGNFVDAGIIGGPPQKPNAGARFYCSGPDTSAFEGLGDFGLVVRPLGPKVGHASGLKMVYAASTKGTTAIWTELLVAAKAMGLGEALERETGGSRIAADVKNGLPSMPRRSRRWVGEMEEIAATFADIGLTPRIFEGAADVYRFVGSTPLGDLTERDSNPALEEMLEVLVQHLGTFGGK